MGTHGVERLELPLLGLGEDEFGVDDDRAAAHRDFGGLGDHPTVQALLGGGLLATSAHPCHGGTGHPRGTE
ncbi:hypothetical protein GCM10022402_04680 [Salinactinospora qingdaonensis]|uniref:Uncharacterized protein n=1 Tax=Salinactinospora qingdaonensis TaxID=702744 RepID=A0ABP7EXA0_9ACTN